MSDSSPISLTLHPSNNLAGQPLPVPSSRPTSAPQQPAPQQRAPQQHAPEPVPVPIRLIFVGSKALPKSMLISGLRNEDNQLQNEDHGEMTCIDTDPIPDWLSFWTTSRIVDIMNTEANISALNSNQVEGIDGALARTILVHVVTPLNEHGLAEADKLISRKVISRASKFGIPIFSIQQDIQPALAADPATSNKVLLEQYHQDSNIVLEEELVNLIARVFNVPNYSLMSQDTFKDLKRALYRHLLVEVQPNYPPFSGTFIRTSLKVVFTLMTMSLYGLMVWVIFKFSDDLGVFVEFAWTVFAPSCPFLTRVCVRWFKVLSYNILTIAENPKLYQCNVRSLKYLCIAVCLSILYIILSLPIAIERSLLQVSVMRIQDSLFPWIKIPSNILSGALENVTEHAYTREIEKVGFWIGLYRFVMTILWLFFIGGCTWMYHERLFKKRLYPKFFMVTFFHSICLTTHVAIVAYKVSVRSFRLIRSYKEDLWVRFPLRFFLGVSVFALSWLVATEHVLLPSDKVLPGLFSKVILVPEDVDN